MFERWSSELGRKEGDGEIAAFTIGFGGVIAGMNSLGDIAKRIGGGGKGEGVMTRHDLVMIWDDMVYILE